MSRLAAGASMVRKERRLWLPSTAVELSAVTRRRIGQSFGLVVAYLPPMCCVVLLGLDCKWWREHSSSLPHIETEPKVTEKDPSEQDVLVICP
mmetsp:Transcript_25271/g.41813  ORF Transcript_25271/g.41813 Transcript_25271/m.41813 type:complete len:93 (-) Transcript_25271:168-446(-)